MKLFEASTVSAFVASQLREQILTNQIKQGEPLRQDTVAKAYNVSIIPVREAFRQLEAEGFVKLLPRRGAVATAFTLDKALEWLNMRRLIETDLMGKAIDRMTDDNIAKAAQILERFDNALDQVRDMKNWSELNWAFHAALYEAAGQTETLAVLESLHKKCDRYHRLQLLDDDHIERAEKEHAHLLELCKSGKKRDAKALTGLHIKRVAEDLKERLQKSPA